jgi:hypothetical protein
MQRGVEGSGKISAFEAEWMSRRLWAKIDRYVTI